MVEVSLWILIIIFILFCLATYFLYFLIKGIRKLAVMYDKLLSARKYYENIFIEMGFKNILFDEIKNYGDDKSV